MPQSRISELAGAAVIQALGSLATLLSIAYLAHVAGPFAQGSFSALKAEFDFFSAFCLFGVPQAVFYFLTSRKIAFSQALTLTAGHGALALLLFGVWAGIFLKGQADYFQSTKDVWLFVLAVAIGAIYVNARAIVLAVRPTVIFSLVTAIPALMLLSLVIIGAAVIERSNEAAAAIANPLIFLMTYGFAAAITLVIIARSEPLSPSPVSFKESVALLRFGVASWIPTVAQAGSTLFAFHWLQKELVLVEELGAFSTAMALVLAALVPLNMVVPIIFKWWAPVSGVQRRLELTKVFAGVLGVGCVGTLIIWLLEPHLVLMIFGDKYLKFLGIYSLMSLSIIPQAAMRIWGVYASSSGRPGVAAWLEVLRFIALTVSIIIHGDDLETTVHAWVIAEYTILFLSVGYFMTKRKEVSV